MTTESPRQNPSMRVPGLLLALLATTATTALVAVAALVAGGAPQVAGTLVGGGLVVGFYLFGTLSTAVAAAYAPQVSFFVALLTYTLQVLLLGVVLVALTRSGATRDELDVRWLAGAVIAGTLTWTVALVVNALRSSRETAPTGDAGPADGSAKITSRGEVRG